MATNKARRGPSVFLPEEMIREILLRLPPRALPRCHTVCKAWRRLATDNALILDHHARQPSRPLTTVRTFVAPHINCLEAVDLSTNERRMFARFVERVPSMTACDGVGLGDATADLAYNIHEALKVHASCDGLLLLSFHETCFVFNPATRQGARLPQLRSGHGIAGFYKHAASGEYRVLYHRVEGLLYRCRGYYVLTMGSREREARIIDYHCCTSSAAVRVGLRRGLSGSYKCPPVLLHGSLNWPPQESQDFNILVFDPAAESFSWIAPPPVPVDAVNYDTQLIEMEDRLAMYCWEQHARISDLWCLEDYEEAKWVCKHRVELPVQLVYEPLPFYPVIPYQEGDILVPEGSDKVLHYDNKGKLQGSFDCFVSGLEITPHVLKESLVLHKFLRTQQDDDDDDDDEWFPRFEFDDDGYPVTTDKATLLKF